MIHFVRIISASTLFVLSLVFQGLVAQTVLPLDSVENIVVFSGSKSISVRCKRKIMRQANMFVNEKHNFPPMVFSIIQESKNELIVKGLTEVPSLKSLHPITFRLRINASKKAFTYRADSFYFEDIKLSLEDWLEKYENSSNERHTKTVNMVSGELESYIFLSIENLAKKINDN